MLNEVKIGDYFLFSIKYKKLYNHLFSNEYIIKESTYFCRDQESLDSLTIFCHLLDYYEEYGYEHNDKSINGIWGGWNIIFGMKKPYRNADNTISRYFEPSYTFIDYDMRQKVYFLGILITERILGCLAHFTHSTFLPIFSSFYNDIRQQELKKYIESFKYDSYSIKIIQ